MKLIVGNKNYSSWSMRAWLALRAAEIEFEEELALLSGEGWREHIRAVSPSGRVPVLIDGDLAVPESLAIIEYAADRYPDRGIWPADIADRARARAMSAEMHAGFAALRNHAPMNLKGHYPGRIDPDLVADDVRRIDGLWSQAIDASGGPFLFGGFGGADAMFAPVAARFETYAIPVSATARGYMDAVFAHPAFAEWRAAALEEPWVVPEDEIDVVQGKAAS